MIWLTTMKDIAKYAGVSQATVSRVISGNTFVDPEIRLRVMEWVRKLDYHPNVIAQSLVGSRSMLIGVIINNITNPFFSEIIRAVESEAAKYGYSIILCNTDGNLDKEKKYINILKSYKADGILMVPSDVDLKNYKSMQKDEIPVVVITRDVPGFSCISISHYNAGMEVAKHLISMGYSKFIFLGTEEDEKFRGFKAQIENSGFNSSKDVGIIFDQQQQSSIYDSLKEFISKNSDSQGIGIFALNDIVALVVLHILKDMKIRVPEEAALVGFDNTFISKEVSPTISSVAQPVEEIGKQSVEILMDMISSKEDIKERHIILEPRLVVRESSVKSHNY
jgi:LacI family transcriptional regulator